jgi:hypothetical protein
MSKIERDKYNVDIVSFEDNTPPGTQMYILEKVFDKFDGKHPNGIDNGYTVIGTFNNPPTIGERFDIRGRHIGQYLSTSPVTEIVDEFTFKTANSVYKLNKFNIV